MDHFNYKNNELYAEDVPLQKIAKELGTPAYIYSQATFTRHLDVLQKAFSGQEHLICYSVKSNGNLSLLKLVAANNCGADIVSGGELFRAQKAGIDPSKTVFSGVGKSAREMAEALNAGILMFNVESKSELAKLAQVAGQMNKVAPIALRVNPDVDPKTHPYTATGLKENKFGIPHHEALALYAEAAQSPHLKVVGLDCHIGSQLTEVEPFVEAAQRLKALVLELKAAGHDLKYLDMGGGLGISYNDETPPAPGEYAKRLKAVLGELNMTIILEPGRVVVGNSAVLLVEVLYNKKTEVKNFIITNGGMNDLIRPSLYGAHHDIVSILKRPDSPQEIFDVVGPICESGDFLGKERTLETPQEGDLLAVKSAGAYAFSMSSNYNARPKAVEVLVDGADFKIIRQRESYEDLVRGE